ncbi:large subunit ribosomal protein [Sciurus carolinensis]|uniref:Large subunit ribosomal protein n=1 Tax=Sciurus carolinensis TaxID=30640 RepID=A0AA41NIB2_SCICA|nr:large subunit ribosomal protein [Sciurus carolinensis]
MEPKTKTEAAAPPEAAVTAKALKAKKAVLKNVHNHKRKKIHMIYLPMAPRHCSSRNSPNILRRAPQEKQA